MIKIKVHIDDINYSNKPSDFSSIKPRLQNNKTIKEIDLEELIKLIEKGYSISPGIMIDGCKSENWTEQKLFMVDIDNNIDNIPLLHIEQALEICKDKNLLPVFYYYTYSHTQEKPKYRLCFILDELIYDSSIRVIIMEVLTSIFKQSDIACKNSDRIFLGTNKEATIVNINNTISLNDILLAHEKNNQLNIKKSYNSDSDINKIKNSFDFFDYLKQKNGIPKRNTNTYSMFENCELCGHKNNLVYYHETNSFMCFSSSCNKGGTIIDYIMILNKCSFKEAINYIKSNLLNLDKSNLTNQDIPLNLLKEIYPSKNYSLDDKGMSNLFMDIYKNNIRFNNTANEWYYYNGKVWIEDCKSMIVSQKAKEFSDILIIYASEINNEDTKINFLKYVCKFGNFKYRETLIKDSKSIYYISNSDLDKNDYLFNCQNGTMNLETFEFKNHNPDDLLSKISNVTYNPDVKENRFEMFINEILQDDKEKVEYLQNILGYSLTVNNFLETSYIFIGTTTRNGKTTLIETFSYMLGNENGYAVNSTPETIALKFNKDSRIASGDIARLNNCRVVSIAELPKSMIIDSSLLKRFTGRDTITARFLNQKEFQFQPKFKLFINCNHLPIITDNTLFTSGRINIISFNRRFEPHEQDIHLKDKLKKKNEISAMFNWCIEGLKKFYKNSNKIITPTSVLSETNEYERDNDKIANFINDCLEKSDKNIKVKDVYERYKIWCQENGMSYENKSLFIDEIKNRNMYKETATVNGKTERNVLCNYELKKDNFINNFN